MNKLMTLSSSEDSNTEEFVDDETFIVKPSLIFDANYIGEIIPEGFDAVRLVLKATVTSSLLWEKEREVARTYIKKGFKIFWEIDLGLFKGLEKPLDCKTQFLSLQLSLDYFLSTIWKEFARESIGLCLYRGPIDFIADYKFGEKQLLNLTSWLRDSSYKVDNVISLESIFMLTKTIRGKDLLRLFCSEASIEYLELLALPLNDIVPLYILLDATEITNPYIKAQLLSKDRYRSLHVGVKEKESSSLQYLGGELSWEGGMLSLGIITRNIKSAKTKELASLGILLPASFEEHNELEQQLISLYKEKKSFRVIPEHLLSFQWEGLNTLFVSYKGINKDLDRKLKGFIAAGGEVIYK